MVNSGTEAAIVVASGSPRAFTGRDKIIKFGRCYHGHADALFGESRQRCGSARPPSSAGVPSHLLISQSRCRSTMPSLRKAFHENKNESAGVLSADPANAGLYLRPKIFCRSCAKNARVNDALLIFDEVITGFRVRAAAHRKFTE